MYVGCAMQPDAPSIAAFSIARVILTSISWLLLLYGEMVITIFPRQTGLPKNPFILGIFLHTHAMQRLHTQWRGSGDLAIASQTHVQHRLFLSLSEFIGLPRV